MSKETYWSRRRFLATSGLAVGGLGAAALIGCGDDDEAGGSSGGGGGGGGAATGAAGTAAPADEAKRGGTLVTPGSDGGIFDPAIAIHGGTFASIHAVYDFLNYLGDGFQVTDGMAELPEVVDDTTIIYKIKPNVYWHDVAPLNGRQFTAEDAAYGLQRFGFDNPQFVFRDRYAAVEQFEVVDNQTLRLNLSAPFAPILKAVAEESALMVSQDVVEEFGDEAVATDFEKQIGTGPMLPVRRVADSERVFARNPNWRGSPMPYFDEYRSINYADAAVRQAAFVAGETDFLNAYWTGSLSEAEDVSAQVGRDNMTLVEHPVSFGGACHFNVTVPPYDDPRVRTALHLSVDRHAIKAFYRGGVVIGGPVAAVIAPYGFTEDELLTRPGYRTGAEREEDLAESRKMLDATGIDLNNLPNISCGTNYTSVAQIFQQNFAEVGYNVGIDELSIADSLATRQSRTGFSMMLLGQQGASDPDLLFNDYHTTGGQNYGNYSDPALDAELEKGRTTLDPAEREEIYDAIQNRLLDEVNARIYFTWSLPTVAMRSYVKGYRSVPGSTTANLVMAEMWFDGKPNS